MIKKRGSGILLHITSLPSKYGIGDMGPEAFRFVDFLSETKQAYWQVLPLTPTNPISDNSPYNSSSAFAGNPLFVSPELMLEEGLLSEKDLAGLPDFPRDRVDYDRVIAEREKLLQTAYERFNKKRNDYQDAYDRFCSENADWLDDFARFRAFKIHFDRKAWNEWPVEIRDRNQPAMDSLAKKLQDKIEYEKFLQYLFYHQWAKLKEYANKKDIRIIGDMPYYVSYDSSDVWTNPEVFKLDEDKRPTFIAGVPPDYFSETGQLWGNPVYRWDLMKERRYAWWIKRLKHNLELFDTVRIDHFRGFVGYWEVPVEEKTAINGEWVHAPAEDFFNTVRDNFPDLPILAEDLGVITEDVKEIIQKFGFAGMKILLFAFDESLPENPYAPHNHIRNCLVYTGTHDNNTSRGWFNEEATPETKERFFRYIGRDMHERDVNWEFVRMALRSVADMVILPVQDVIGLGSEAKMNRPGTGEGNWRWRLQSGQIREGMIRYLRELTEIYGRANSGEE